LSFLKRLVPLKGTVSVGLDKPVFVEGEPVTGNVNVDCEEYVQSEGVRVEGRAIEHFEEMEWVTENNQRVPRMVQKTNTLFSRDESINGPSDFGQGPTRSFPFSVGIPSLRPAHSGGRIETMIKGVVAVKGRPDMTGTVQIAFTAPTYAVIGAPVQPYLSTPPFAPPGQAQGSQAGYAPGPVQQKPQIRCSYCKTLLDQRMTFCPNCGAHQ